MDRGIRAESLVLWREAEGALTLGRDTVLTYRMSWPQAAGEGRGLRRISRYYDRLAAAWRRRWERDIYWRPCLDLARRREAGLPFRPWSGTLSGEVTAREADLLALRMEAREIWGDGRTLCVCWGDVWDLEAGAPCPLSRVAGGRRGWRTRLLEQAVRNGRERREAGDCFLDPGWEGLLRRRLSRLSFCLTPDALELLLPQCAAAPAAEGAVRLCVPRPALSLRDP